MADISKLTLPTGSSYDIKDATARTDIADLKTKLTGAMHYVGITSTALTDGATTNPITVDGASVTAVAGSVAIYSEKEFVFNGTKWQEFGSTGSLKALAFKDNASGKYTPAGSVGTPTITVTPSTTNVKATASGAAVGVASSAKAITGLGTASTEDFVKSYPGSTSKLKTTSITPVNGTESIRPPSLGTAIAADDITSWSAGSASTWAFSVSNETLSISGANSTAPSLGYTARSIPNVSLGTAVSVAKAGTAVTVATGALDANDTAGATVMTGLGTATTGKGVTGYSSPSTDTFAKTVSVTAQPTIALATGATAGTGVISVATGISSASSTKPTWTGTEGTVTVS